MWNRTSPPSLAVVAAAMGFCAVAALPLARRRSAAGAPARAVPARVVATD